MQIFKQPMWLLLSDVQDLVAALEMITNIAEINNSNKFMAMIYETVAKSASLFTFCKSQSSAYILDSKLSRP